MLNQAITELCSLPDSQIVDISSFYESEPAYYLDQDSFVNAVVLLRTGIPPKELLGYLHAVENSLGRVREVRNGPRHVRPRYPRLPAVRRGCRCAHVACIRACWNAIS